MLLKRAGYETVIPALSEPDMDEELGLILRSCSDRSINLSQFISRFAEVVKIPQPKLAETQINQFVEANSRFLLHR